jgi:peptide/nickel transport system ATP-binding protein
MINTNSSILRAESLTIEYRIGRRWLSAVRDVSLSIAPLHIHGLVGESGSGKSTLGLGLMKYLAKNARIVEGTLWFNGQDITQHTPDQMRALWGSQIGLVPQNPLDALNPALKIGEQMAEATERHLGLSRADALQRAREALTDVKIANPDAILDNFPHHLSGGMQQRVMIALALSTRPRLLILDEPTTALDVTTQAVILDLVRELIQKDGAAALYVSHDLGTVVQLCDTVTVLYAGETMENAPIKPLFAQPLHPYTVGLLASLPRASDAGDRLSTIAGVAPSLAERPPGCVFHDRCPVAIDQCRSEKPPIEMTEDGRQVRCWRWKEVRDGTIIPKNAPPGKLAEAPVELSQVLETFDIRKNFGERSLLDVLTGREGEVVHAVDDVSIRINRRSTLGLVGESGSGKTTLARSIMALYTATSGTTELLNAQISNRLDRRELDELRNLQMIFQNPGDALNPFMTVGETIGRAFKVLSQDHPSRQNIQTEVLRLLRAVGLTDAYYDRFPDQLSGGEKQRVAIARAFAASPAVVVADEPTSSLDVSVQAVILNLLKDLRAQEGASYLIISHDLDVIRYLADWVVVMYLGQVIEQGTAMDVTTPPMHPYTEALLNANPVPDPDVPQGNIRLDGELPSATHRPTGCWFHSRCPRKIGAICETDAPPLRELPNDHQIRCHYTAEELTGLQRNGESN